MSDVENTATTPETAEPTKAPLVSVLKGNPTPEQVAVLTAVVAATAASSGTGAPQQTERNLWGRPIDRLRPNWSAPTSFHQNLW